jgi:hypothetical protein
MDTIENNATATATSAVPSASPEKKARKRGSKKAAPVSRLVTATLPKRLIRVQFKVGSKVVATSPFYNSGNTIQKIVAYARQTLKPGSNAVAATQIQGGKLTAFKG